LTIKIDEGCIGEILCPFLGCYTIIPNEIIEKLISKETARKYLQFDIKVLLLFSTKKKVS
jgi:ankyrin repeat/IBR domain-containing protein 1